MNKVRKGIVLCMVACLFSLNAYGVCKEGTEVTGKNGHVYCVSNVTMNWYTAFAWCDTQGRTLATMEQICDIDETERWDGNTGEGKCLNMVGAGLNRWAWSSIPSGSTSAFYVHKSTGYVNRYYRADTTYALCW